MQLSGVVVENKPCCGFKNNVLSARVELLQAGKVNRNTTYFQPLLCLLAAIQSLLLKHCVLIHYSIFCFKSVTKYFAQGILVIQSIVIYDF